MIDIWRVAPLCGVCMQRNRSHPAFHVLASHNGELHISHKMLSSTSYDGQGFWLAQKRLSAGKYRFWPEGGAVTKRLEAHELQVLLAAGDPTKVQAAPAWRRVSPEE
jgi:hypothetical protein